MLYNMQGYETVYKVCNKVGTLCINIHVATVYVLVLLNVM